MGTHDLLQISLAGREAVLQRGAGKTPHALGQNYKEPAVFSKVRIGRKGLLQKHGEMRLELFFYFLERESWSKGLRRWRKGRAEGEREYLKLFLCPEQSPTRDLIS